MKNCAVLGGCSVRGFVLFFKSYSALFCSYCYTPWVLRIKRTALMTSFHCFLFRPLHSLRTRPSCSHALHKPKCGSPIFGKQHAASHYTTSGNDVGVQESYLLFGWQDFWVARFASRAKLKIRNAKPGLASKHPDAMFTLYRIALTQAHG